MNRKVNLGNPIAKERNAEFVVITARQEPEPAYLNFGKCDFFQSVFFTKIFAYMLSAWITINILGIIKAYKSFGTLVEKGLTAVSVLFMLLSNFDQYKDLQYLIVNEHSMTFSLCYSTTITLPLFISIALTK